MRRFLLFEILLGGVKKRKEVDIDKLLKKKNKKKKRGKSYLLDDTMTVENVLKQRK